MRAPHTHSDSHSRWFHTGNRLHFSQHQKIWQKCGSAFLLDFRDTLHKLAASFQHRFTGIFTQDSRQQTKSHGNHLSFFTARGRTRHFYACAVSPLPSVPLPLVPWNSKIIEVFLTPWKSLGMRSSSWLVKRLLQGRCLDMLVSFVCFVNLTRNFNFILNTLCSNWDNKRNQVDT